MRITAKTICQKCDREDVAQADIERGQVILVDDNKNYCSECGAEVEVDRYGADELIAAERADRDRKEREEARKYFNGAIGRFARVS